MCTANNDCFKTRRGNKILICLDQRLTKNQKILKLIDFSLAHPKNGHKVHINFAIFTKDHLIKFCEDFVQYNQRSVKFGLSWVEGTTIDKKISDFQDPLKILTIEQSCDVFAFISEETSLIRPNLQQILDGLAHRSDLVHLHARLLLRDKLNEPCAPTSFQKSVISKLRLICQFTLGSLGIIRFFPSPSQCSKSCFTWHLDHSLETKKPLGQVHMQLEDYSSSHITLPDGTLIPNYPLDHQPVLMTSTLAAPYGLMNTGRNQNNHEPHEEDQPCTNPNHWSRISVDNRILKDLNQRLQRSAQDEAVTNQFWSTEGLKHLNLRAPIIGRHVLARRHKDGYYYAGVVQSLESRSLTDYALIRFGPIRHGSCIPKFRKEIEHCNTTFMFEFIELTDLIDMKSASEHIFNIGDNVLIPETWPLPICAMHNIPNPTRLKHLRYQPGRIVDLCDDSQESDWQHPNFILVELENSPTRVGLIRLPIHLAIWISPVRFRRICLEQRMPASSREWLRSKTFLAHTYPNQSAPGYPSDDFEKFLPEYRTQITKRLLEPIQFCQFKATPELQVQCDHTVEYSPVSPVIDSILFDQETYAYWLDRNRSEQKLGSRNPYTNNSTNKIYQAPILDPMKPLIVPRMR